MAHASHPRDLFEETAVSSPIRYERGFGRLGAAVFIGIPAALCVGSGLLAGLVPMPLWERIGVLLVGLCVLGVLVAAIVFIARWPLHFVTIDDTGLGAGRVRANRDEPCLRLARDALLGFGAVKDNRLPLSVVSIPRMSSRCCFPKRRSAELRSPWST